MLKWGSIYLQITQLQEQNWKYVSLFDMDDYT